MINKESTHLPKILPKNLSKNLSKKLSKKRKKCLVENCCDKVAIIVGDCKYCDGNYCLKHRLPEDHLCTNLLDKKNNDRQKVETKLLAEKCVPQKLARF